LSVERNGKKKGESPGRVDLGKRKTKRHAATKAAKKVQYPGQLIFISIALQQDPIVLGC
jgi:hypothetical protein